MFYLMMHSTHFIYSYTALHIELWTTQIVTSGNVLSPLQGLLLQISSKEYFIGTIPQTGQYVSWIFLHCEAPARMQNIKQYPTPKI